MTDKHRIRIKVGYYAEDESAGILEAMSESQWDAGGDFSESNVGATEVRELWVEVDCHLRKFFQTKGIKGVVKDD